MKKKVSLKNTSDQLKWLEGGLRPDGYVFENELEHCFECLVCRYSCPFLKKQGCNQPIDL